VGDTSPRCGVKLYRRNNMKNGERHREFGVGARVVVYKRHPADTKRDLERFWRLCWVPDTASIGTPLVRADVTLVAKASLRFLSNI
jgi:hypothetical protein